MDHIVRPADAAELRRIPALLPRWQLQPEDECLVAEATHPSRLVGMGICGKRPGENGNSVAHLDVVVFSRFRNAKTIRSLLTPLLSHAAAQGLPAAHLVTPQRRTNPAFQHFQELGFIEHRTLLSYEFSLPLFAARTRSAFDILVRRKSIPAGAKVVALAPAYWPAVSRLAWSENLIDARTKARAESEGLDTYFSPVSRVLLLDGEVQGAALTHSLGRKLETSALFVAPGLRGGAAWANALLTHHAAVIATELGFEVITMAADPVRHPMTTLLARRLNSPGKEEEVLLMKWLDNC